MIRADAELASPLMNGSRSFGEAASALPAATAEQLWSSEVIRHSFIQISECEDYGGRRARGGRGLLFRSSDTIMNVNSGKVGLMIGSALRSGPRPETRAETLRVASGDT